MYISLKFSHLAKDSSWKAFCGRPISLLFGAFLYGASSLLTTGAAAANVVENDMKAPVIVKASENNASSNTTKAKLLVKDILASYGGEQKFRQVYENGRHGFGKYTEISALSGAVNTFNVEVFYKGNKIREEMRFFGEPLVGGFDGKHSWLKQAGEVIEDNPAGGDQVRQEIEHGLQLLLKLPAKNTRIEYIEPAKNKAGEYDILQVTAGDGASTFVYADKKTHLIARTEFVGVEEEQGLSVTKSFRYEDYRPFSGSVIPYKMSEYVGEKKASETVLTSILAQPLADTLFQVPKASPLLLSKNESVTIPFQLIGGEIIIDVTINGKSGYTFAVDTGATQTVMDSEVAPLLGITKQTDLSITTGAGSVPTSYMHLNSLGVGKLIFRDTAAAVADLSALKKVVVNKNLVGMLGANTLRQFLVTFDFPNKTISFAHPDSRIAKYKTISVLPAKPSLGGAGMLIAGTLDGKAINCLIDTGAAYSLIPYELAKQIADKPIPAENVVHGLDGKPVKVAEGNFKILKLGDEIFRYPVFLVAFEKTKPMGMLANGSVAILGNPTWKYLCLTLDYKGQKVILWRPLLSGKP